MPSRKYRLIIDYIFNIAREFNITISTPTASENGFPVSSAKGRVIVISKTVLQHNKASAYMLSHEIAHILSHSDVEAYVKNKECMQGCENLANVFGALILLKAYVHVTHDYDYQRVMDSLYIPYKYKYQVIDILDTLYNGKYLDLLNALKKQFLLYRERFIDFIEYVSISNRILRENTKKGDSLE